MSMINFGGLPGNRNLQAGNSTVGPNPAEAFAALIFSYVDDFFKIV